jgi:hypothetical protein
MRVVRCSDETPPLTAGVMRYFIPISGIEVSHDQDRYPTS